ncbi:MAG: phosphoribosylformylglycinamidine synthase [Fusobacterium sp.]|uniref:phosphoribosylformylglycinamidine synthase n=1 Tax=Fusobacterium sp. TaxID=68766 RepID=UPI0026DBBFFD|nr:phosphoribosylformylglycinamidine synthase [Fusobacterium sp.]MDO4689943.1 phosphoribosylformylglycinamidine synthase [Fusobacterium sp.]
MSDLRFFVEKKNGFDLDAKRLLAQFKEELNINSLEDLRLINCYDLFNLSGKQENVEKIKRMILSEVVTDNIFEKIDLTGKKYFAVEYLPGQFDQRADSTLQCIDIVVEGEKNVEIKTAKLIILSGDLTDEEFNKIKNFYINPIETREKDLNLLAKEDIVFNTEVVTYDDFLKLSEEELKKLRDDLALSMSFEDLKYIQDYFKEEKRNPTETEIKVFDTYWSDHCRHTTFETKILNVEFPESEFGKDMSKEFQNYLEIKNIVAPHKDISLMDMATVMGKYLRKTGKLEDLEVSEENNACSVYIDVETEDFSGKKAIEKWLLMFKNETHNHPTEIEPFGGASTCLGGAIRDPLSGRAYVYQAIRVSGAANPLERVEDTLKGKLTQKKITKGAASGYSSYGNQIGIATSLVSEIYHEGYKAKRMEVGAVVAAAPVENVVRKSPAPEDSIILIGGKTGRDGCGGATGSSKEHTDDSLLLCGAEVQKGNAPEERKIQRLFRNPKATKLIKKCNDFGAGGVSVAIGELADGVEVNLDLVPTKYDGLNGTELAISESQERMAIIVSKEDTDEFLKYVAEENLLGTVVGRVTKEARLILRWKGKDIVNISRAFLNTNGIKQTVKVEVKDYAKKASPFKAENKYLNLEEKWVENISKLNVASQKGLCEMFDSMVGAGTVLMPFGGKYQMTPIDVSIAKLPVLDKDTKTASAITYGFNPYVSEWSTYHGAMYAVVESLAKLVAAGVDYTKARLSFQEYFEKLGKDAYKWSKPLLALLGTIKVQKDFEIAAIGGKDSMSGTFNDINVPPTLISFAVTSVNIDNVISPEFKKSGNKLYLIENKMDDKFFFDSKELKENFNFVLKNMKEEKIVSAMAIKAGGLSEALSKMSFGNRIGFNLENEEIDLFSLRPGSIVVESTDKLEYKNAVYLGETISEFAIKTSKEKICLEKVEEKWLAKLDTIFPHKLDEKVEVYKDLGQNTEKKILKSSITVAKPRVLIAAFPGTNSEYDMYNVFNKNGGESKIRLFRNLNQDFIRDSIEQIVKDLENSQIFVLPGGFSAGDEPDGSGKFIAAILQNPRIKEAIEKFMERNGLILGICNGFQALIKSGLLPYGKIGKLDEKSPTLTFNKIGRHISQMVKTKIVSNSSPWLSSFEIGDSFDIPVSHGEGRFYADEETLKELIKNNQIATQYVNFDLEATNEFRFNPNGSSLAIEGIISPDGKILGKMGHSERYSDGIFKNIDGKLDQNIFLNGIKYFK